MLEYGVLFDDRGQLLPPPLYKSIIIPNSQVRTAFSTPVVLYPAYVGQAIVPERLLITKPAGAAFGIAGVTAIEIIWTGGSDPIISHAVLNGFLDVTTAQSYLGTNLPGSTFIANAGLLLSSPTNRSMTLRFTGANPTLGTDLIVQLVSRVWTNGQPLAY